MVKFGEVPVTTGTKPPAVSAAVAVLSSDILVPMIYDSVSNSSPVSVRSGSGDVGVELSVNIANGEILCQISVLSRYK